MLRQHNPPLLQPLARMSLPSSEGYSGEFEHVLDWRAALHRRWLVDRGEAFKESIWWGLGSLIIPLVGLIFAIMNFAENKIPLLLYVIGIVVLFVGGAFSGQAPVVAP